MPRKQLTDQDWMEICDLYNWGARMSDIAMLYDRHVKYLSLELKKHGCVARKPFRPAQVEAKRRTTIKSTRPLLPSGAVPAADGHEEIDQLLRSSARALQAQRIEARRADANTRSCQGAVS